MFDKKVHLKVFLNYFPFLIKLNTHDILFLHDYGWACRNITLDFFHNILKYKIRTVDLTKTFNGKMFKK